VEGSSEVKIVALDGVRRYFWLRIASSDAVKPGIVRECKQI
jgi:hypothetical protein